MLAGQGFVDFPLSSPLPLLSTICTSTQMSKEVLNPPSDYLYHAKSAQDLAALLKDDLKVRVAGLDVDGVMRGKVRLAVARRVCTLYLSMHCRFSDHVKEQVPRHL